MKQSSTSSSRFPRSVSQHGFEQRTFLPHQPVQRMVRSSVSDASLSYVPLETHFMAEAPNNAEVTYTLPKGSTLPAAAGVRSNVVINKNPIPHSISFSQDNNRTQPPPPRNISSPGSQILRAPSIMSSASSSESLTSLHQLRPRRPKEKEWYESSLDSPVTSRKGKLLNASFDSVDSNMSSRSEGKSRKQETTYSDRPKRSDSTTKLVNGEGYSHLTNGESHLRHSVANPTPLPQLLEATIEHEDNKFSSVVPFESPQNQTLITPGQFRPSREVTKPFEMSDFYKYSTRFRKPSQNSSKSEVECSPNTTLLSENSSIELSVGCDISFTSSISNHSQVFLNDASLPALNPPPVDLQKGLYTPPQPMACEPLPSSAALTPRGGTPSKNPALALTLSPHQK